MRTKIKTKKNLDFTKALNLNELTIIRLEKETKKLLEKGLDFSKIIEVIWNNKKFTDNEVIWIIFNLGIAYNRREVMNNSKRMLNGLNVKDILDRLR